MKAGRSLQDLSQQILEENRTKRDFVADTSALSMTVVEPPESEGTPDVGLQFTVNQQQQVFKPTVQCLEQIAARVGIPAKYAERMRTEAPELLCRNVNHWFASKPERRMLRTLCNGHKIARAFLSDRYRILDNFDLFAAVMPKLKEAGCIIRSAEITEKRFYIQASTPRIQAIIDQNVKIGTHNRIQRTVEAGVIIGNSETGNGSIFVDPIMHDLVCTNGLILQRTLKRHHVGRRNEGEIWGDENTSELFSDETRKLDDKAFWAKVSDVVSGALDQIKFNENIERLRKLQNVQLAKDATDVSKVVEAVADRFDLIEQEKANMLLHFAQGGDFSQYGLVNAVTRLAEDVPSYDRAVDIERLGGKIMELPPSDFLRN
jgi:hypothetical protein